MTGSPLETWHRAELAKLDGIVDSPRWLLTGCPIWGPRFVDLFLDYCWPTIRAIARDVVLYVDAYAKNALQHLQVLELRSIPEVLVANINEGHARFPMLAAIHNILVHRAGRAGAGFHMLVPDHCYAKGYFPALRGLSQSFPAICHTSLYLPPNNALDAPLGPRALGDLAWRTLTGAKDWMMNAGGYPNSAVLAWQGKDYIRMHSPTMTPVWISPELCRRARSKYGGTLDSALIDYIGGEFAVPGLEDEMVFVHVSDGAVAPSGRLTAEQWKATFRPAPYFIAPSYVPIVPQETYMADDEIDAQFQNTLEMLR